MGPTEFIVRYSRCLQRMEFVAKAIRSSSFSEECLLTLLCMMVVVRISAHHICIQIHSKPKRYHSHLGTQRFSHRRHSRRQKLDCRTVNRLDPLCRVCIRRLSKSV